MNQFISRKKRHAQRRRFYSTLAALSLAITLISVIGVVPALWPAAGASAAHLIPSVAGPQSVAGLETVSDRIQDVIHHMQYSLGGEKSQISVDGQSGSQDQPLPISPAPEAQAQSRATGLPTLETPLPSNPVPPTGTSVPLTDVVNADPYIGWQPYGPTLHGQAMLAQTVVMLDPDRPYAGIALVRIDLSLPHLHMVPAYLGPPASPAVQSLIPNLGLIPKPDLGQLVAAFNGGFKTVNGHFGMTVNHVTLLPAFPGVATLAIFEDGHIQLGTWGRDLFPIPEIVSLRQNCPPILQDGKINPLDSIDDHELWGLTVGNQEISWRSGLGMSADGRFLIYAVGNGTTIPLLAQALQKAGASNAMQLDINQHFIHFVTYARNRTNTTLSAIQLLDQMEADPNVFLTASSRDFFYLTSR